MNMENNQIALEGQIVSDFRFSHETMKEKFYLFDLKTERLSGTSDVLPVLISERLVNIKENPIGATVRVEGQIRSYNKQDGEKSRMLLSIFVESIENTQEEACENYGCIQGFLCKEPVYRKTPRGKEITDMILAVNRQYGKTDYIPCIAWGRNAIFAAMQPIGTELKIYGRFQSRQYKKRLVEDGVEIRTAYEFSVHVIEEVVNDECED